MTGWSDTWMLSRYAKHPNCMLKWMAWMVTPEVQAQVAEYFGEAPANPKACDILNKGYGSYKIPNFCDAYHVTDQAFYNAISFWKTPIRDCGDSRGTTCIAYDQWLAGVHRREGLTSRRTGTTAGPGDPAADPRPRTTSAACATSDMTTAELAPPGRGRDACSAGSTGDPRIQLGRSSLVARPAGSGSSTSGRSRSCSRTRSGRSTRRPARSSSSSPWPTSSGCSTQPVYRHDRPPDGDRGRGRDRRRRAPRLPDRLLHGPRRLAPPAGAPVHVGPAAALGELPRQGLRLAGDPGPERPPRLGAPAASGIDSASASSGSPTCR